MNKALATWLTLTVVLFSSGVKLVAQTANSTDAPPALDAFIPVEVEPRFDYDALARRIVYPPVSRANNIQGKVIVAALIGIDGRIEKIQVIDSVDVNLNEAALKAVQETTFQPALQNEKPVRTWVRIPVMFRLRNDDSNGRPPLLAPPPAPPQQEPRKR